MNKNQEQDEFIAVRVQDPRVQNEGFWNSYVDFKIFLHTNSKAFTAKTSCVRRRYSEFVWLKKKLQKNSGLVPVPELPGKTPFFSFNNEDFIERRRRGLQNFLDKLVHMTVCLSDSQLHLFVQTQLPVRHIEDCIQGHTPYTVTDAILTYASSNRGWAQEEEGVAQEPSLHAVSYESVDSPAPHLPTLQCEKTFECRASVADIHEEDVNETCAHEVNGNDTNTCVIRGTEIGVEKETSEEDVHKAYVPETYTCVIRGTEASVDEKQNNEEGVHEVDVHETNTSVIGAIEDIAEKQDASEEDVHKADVHEHDYIPDFKPDPQDNDTFTLKVTLTHSEEDSNEDDVLETSVYKANTHSTSSCVIMGTDAGGDEKDIEQDVHEVEADTCVVRVTEAIGEEKHSNEEDIHKFYACDDNSCVIGAMDGTIEEKYASEEDVLKTDVDETSTCLIMGTEANAMEKDSNEEDVPKVAAYDTNACIIWSMEGAIEEEDVSEEDAQDENAQETSTCVIGAIDSAIEEDASEEFVHETSAHEANTNEHNSIPNSKLDAQDTDTCVTLADTHGEDTNEEDVHKVDTHDIIICVSGTTEDDTPERDSIVLSDSDNSQEELSIETNKDEADTNDAINSLIEASDAVVREDTQDTNSDTDPVHCANSFVFGASETIIHKIDGGKSVDHETENQEPEVHEIDNHTEFNGQLESTDTNC